MPWVESTQRGGITVPEIKGVLVLFADNQKMLKQSVLHRWLGRDLKAFHAANVCLAARHQVESPNQAMPLAWANFELNRLLYDILSWFISCTEGHPELLPTAPLARTLRDLDPHQA